LSGSTATFQLPASDLAAPGAAAVVPVTLSATDVAGNRASVDGGTLRVDDEPPAVSLQPLSLSAWFGGGLDVEATTGDGAGSGVASAALLIDGQPAGAGARSGDTWSFHADLAQMLPGREGPATVQVVAADAVGNSGGASRIIQVDTVAPVISAARVDSLADGRDAAGQDWFRGPTTAPGAPDIVVSAAIADVNLVPAPSALVAGTRYPGAAAGDRWTFSIPRSVGLNAAGPIPVTFDAEDLAGNHPVASPSVALYFDDVSAAAFKPSIAPDPAWYGRNAAVRLPVAVTLPSLPRSGISSVILRVADQADSGCAKVGPSAYLCLLASLSAPSAAETVLPFEVIATSVAGIPSSASGSCNIDDAPPVISNTAAIPYPGPAGALAWSHDGAHFNVKDDGVLYTFKAHDCGSGVRSVTAFTLAPQPGSRAAGLIDSGERQACANGTQAVVYDVSVSANLATLPAGALPAADNVLNVSVTVADGASDGASGFVQHAASQGKAVSVTRRLWQTGALGLTRLALGPFLVASSSGAVAALSPRDGSAVWSQNPGNVLGSPVVGGSAGVPVVYYTTGSASAPGATLKKVSASDGSALAADCMVLASASLTCHGGFRTHSSSLALATDGTPVLADNVVVDSGVNGEFDCWSSAAAVSRGCVSWIPNTVNVNLDLPFVGRAGQVFFVQAPTNPSQGLQPGILRESNLGSPGAVLGPSCNSIDVLTDAAGADAPACNGQRYSFDGSAFSPAIWTSASVSPARTLPQLDLFFAADGSAHSLASGSSIPGFNGAGTPLLIDGSSSPVLYSSGGSSLSALHINALGYGATALGLPAVPGGVVDDALLDRSGILYVASNGQVSAIATGSPGPAGGTAWPTRNRDNCRSNNLEFACPY
jgi:hypothetical protein